MNPNASLAEIAKPVVSIAPISCSTGATATGLCINAGYTQQISVVVKTALGAGTARFTLEQCTANDGTGAKTLAFPPYLFKDADTTDKKGNLVKTATANDRIDLTASMLAVIDIRPEMLDLANSFNYIRVKMVEQGAGTIIVAADANIFQRYMGAGNEPDLT